jgi:hypothetical protein
VRSFPAYRHTTDHDISLRSYQASGHDRDSRKPFFKAPLKLDHTRLRITETPLIVGCGRKRSKQYTCHSRRPRFRVLPLKITVISN